MIDYDAELQLHNEQLRAAYGIGTTDRVLDIGCGAGQTTRDAARLASGGSVLGVDIDAGMIARARELADAAGVSNVQFEVGDVQTHPFRPAEFDVAISRFGTMFFADLEAAFRNVSRAIRAGGRLAMMVWQAYDRNEWAVSIDRAVTGGAPVPAAGSVWPDPFSLAEPATVRSILASAGFTEVRFTDVDAPVYYGQDVDAAVAFVSRFASVADALLRGDPTSVNSAVTRLGNTLEAHTSERGVWFDSLASIVMAKRQ
jgi:ubiquinone/menaquinone biosynthesis C-methylase UbiE